MHAELRSPVLHSHIVSQAQERHQELISGSRMVLIPRLGNIEPWKDYSRIPQRTSPWVPKTVWRSL